MGIAAIINIVLDIILVGPFGMGTAGTAYATVTAQGLSFVISLFYLKRHRIFFSAENHSKFTLQWDKLAAIVKVGLPTTIQMAVVNTAYLLVAGMLNQFGTAVSAASNVGLQINTLCRYTLLGYWTGRNGDGRPVYGSRAIGRARKVIKISLVMNVAVTLVAVIGVQLFAEPLILLFGSTPETVNNGVYYLAYLLQRQ
ncbi:MAG: MATE family efflux transporter [Enterocloster clostridioformis]